jgi:hypothetical protein
VLIDWIRGVLPRRSAAPASKKPVRLDFDEIYRRNTFGSNESHSGEGSELHATSVLRAELPAIFAHLGVRSVLDLPCGDFNWMKRVDLRGCRYIGGDIVAEIVAKNMAAHTDATHTFQHLDLVKGDLPKCDLVFCRDCLVHLPYEDISKAIANVRRSGATWFASTTFVRRTQNSELFGVWRPLNLELSPFHFPKPAQLLNEGYWQAGADDFSDKSVGFWRVSELPTSLRP